MDLLLAMLHLMELDAVGASKVVVSNNKLADLDPSLFLLVICVTAVDAGAPVAGASGMDGSIVRLALVLQVRPHLGIESY